MKERKMTFVASDSSRDSHRTVLNPDGWDLKRYNANGIVGYQHKVYNGKSDMANPDNVIGRGYAYLQGEGKDKRLMVDVTFEPEGTNELADKVWRKLEFGTLNGVSVGFRPIGQPRYGQGDQARGGTDETIIFDRMELLEVSVVNIPSNPNALRTDGKPGARRGASADHVQHIHLTRANDKDKALALAKAALALLPRKGGKEEAIARAKKALAGIKRK